MRTTLLQRGSEQKRKRIFDQAEAWFKQYTHRSENYQHKLIAVENAIAFQQERKFPRSTGTDTVMAGIDLYQRKIRKRQDGLMKSVHRLKDCHADVKRGVLQDDDLSLYEKVNRKYRENEALLLENQRLSREVSGTRYQVSIQRR